MEGGGNPKQPIDLDAESNRRDYEAYDPAEDRETARRKLAYSLLGLLVFVVSLILIAAVAGCISVGEAKDLSVAILTPVVALVGTALGFYFGGNHS